LYAHRFLFSLINVTCSGQDALTTLDEWSGLEIDGLSLGFDSPPEDQYLVLVYGQLAEKIVDHKAYGGHL
jgi:hypothetical protein